MLVIVSSYSRFITAMMLPSRSPPDLLAGMWTMLGGQLGAVPRRLTWDNEAGIGRRNRLAEDVNGFCGTLATRIVQLKAFDPESKGIVGRANQYLETSFLPGRSLPRRLQHPAGQVAAVGEQPIVRRIAARPDQLVVVDRAAMLALPPVAPGIGFAARVRLPRDYYVRMAGNDYSVDPAVIGRIVAVRADLGQVTVTYEDRRVRGPRSCR